MQEARCYQEVQEANNGCLEVQEETVGIWRCRRQAGGAEGKQWVSGGAQLRQGVGIWRCRLAQDSDICDDPFQTVPGPIPGSCIPAFTGTHSMPPIFKAERRKIETGFG